MKVWILEVGCKFEGGHAIAVYPTEQAAVAGAIAYMQKEIARDAEIYLDPESTEEGLVVTGFLYDGEENGNHAWTSCSYWSYNDENDQLAWYGGGGEYISLKWYELQSQGIDLTN